MNTTLPKLAEFIAEKLQAKYLEKLQKYNRANEEDLPEILHEIIDGRLQPSGELREFAELADMANQFNDYLNRYSQNHPNELKDLYEVDQVQNSLS